MSDEVTALQNEVASLRKQLEIAKKATAELTYQKIIGQLLDRLAECDRSHDD